MSEYSTKKKQIGLVKVVIPILAAIFFMMVIFSIFSFRRNSKRTKLTDSSFDEPYPKVSYSQLVIATNRFSSANLISTGKYGSVYKGSLDQSELWL